MFIYNEKPDNSKVFTLLIAGSRTFGDASALAAKADAMLAGKMAQGYEIRIIQGEARGADSLAKDYALSRGYMCYGLPADWDRFGKSAGYRRNDEMHRLLASFPERGCLCFWDGSSRGTAHNFELSKKYGTQLRVWNYTENRWMKNL